MIRRLTVGSRSEMGLLTETLAEERTPIKADFWKRPSRWQICLPRLRILAKIALSVLFALLILRIYFDSRPVAVDKPTEAELIEASQRENWLWKDFPRFVNTRRCAHTQLTLTLVPLLDMMAWSAALST